MSESEDQIDWSLTTWEGSRRAQLRDWMKLTLTEKWQAVEDMADWARETIETRRSRGLPYIDPYTGERVAGTRVREEPARAQCAPTRRSWMATRAQIEEFARRVAAEFQPERIILFGSHAYGTPTEDSDVDLLVVMPHEGRPHEHATRIRGRVPRSFPMDLLVRDPMVLRQRLEWNDFFLREIVERGITLYETADARVD